ncbi:MAG: ParB/RepB/Spo0J family partition protein, partial [Caldimonas sp.]
MAPVPSNQERPGRAGQLAINLLDEDTRNPRTEFPDTELEELTEDIREHGVLQPIVVHAADENGRHLIHFGSKRLRAARRAGMTHVPVVIRDLPADPYSQVAENQKRHGLSPLDM